MMSTVTYEAKLPSPEQISAEQHFEDPRSKAITNALTYIDNELDYKNNAFALDNPLVTLKPPKPPTTKVDRLETIINRLQAPDYDWKLRLAQGAYYYEKLVTLVQDRTKAADRPFLYQMLPAGIRWLPQNEQSPFQFAYSAYTTQRDYETDLIAGDMDKMLRNVTHPFVPNQVAFARREVMLAKLPNRGAAATPNGERCALRFLDSASSSGTRVRDWIVYRTLDNERHLWKIVDTLEASGRDHIVVSPVGDPSRTLFGAGQGDQIEALYYRRIVPAKYYLDVLGLYLLNLLVANSSITTNNREKIDVDDLEDWADPLQKGQPGIWDGISRRLFNGNTKNALREIYELIAEIYVNLTWHSSSSSYHGKAAAGRQEDLDPSAFLLDVVNDAKKLRNKVEDFLGVPLNTFENEWPTPERLQRSDESVDREFSVLLASPLDIKQLIIESRRSVV